MAAPSLTRSSSKTYLQLPLCCAVLCCGLLLRPHDVCVAAQATAITSAVAANPTQAAATVVAAALVSARVAGAALLQSVATASATAVATTVVQAASQNTQAGPGMTCPGDDEGGRGEGSHSGPGTWGFQCSPAWQGGTKLLGTPAGGLPLGDGDGDNADVKGMVMVVVVKMMNG